MDKQLLVNQAERLLTDLQQHGVEVYDYRWSPAYPGFKNSSYLLGIVAPFLNQHLSLKKSAFLTERIFTVFNEEERGIISSVLSYNTSEEMNQDMDEREGVGRPVVEPYWPD